MSNQATLKNLFAGRVKLDTVLDHIQENMTKQGKASVNEKGNCMYFSADGCNCAIGSILPKSLKGKIREGGSVFGLIKENTELFGYKKSLLSLGSDPVLQCLMSVQRAHDYAATCENFAESFNNQMKHVRSRYTEMAK